MVCNCGNIPIKLKPNEIPPKKDNDQNPPITDQPIKKSDPIPIPIKLDVKEDLKK